MEALARRLRVRRCAEPIANPIGSAKGASPWVYDESIGLHDGELRRDTKCSQPVIIRRLSCVTRIATKPDNREQE